MRKTDFGSQSDDKSHYLLGDSIDDVFKLFEDDSIYLSNWFLTNQMKANRNKCHRVTNQQIFINLAT